MNLANCSLTPGDDCSLRKVLGLDSSNNSIVREANDCIYTAPRKQRDVVAKVLESCRPVSNCSLTPGVNCTDSLCAYTAPAVGNSTHCIVCKAGKIDNRYGECISCETGTYASAGSVDCIKCPTGFEDDDLDAATPCVFLGNSNPCSTQSCGSGHHDHDCDAGTPCVRCAKGTAQTKDDVRRELIRQANGSFVPEDICVTCRAGWADGDSNASTTCTQCPAGTFSAASSTACAVCAAGWSDHDKDSATPCKICPGGRYAPESGRNGSCENCLAGKSSSVIGATSAVGCTACHVGEWTSFPGAPACTACPKGSYRSALDMEGCVRCVNEADDNIQFLCDEANMTWPKASAGHYTNWPTNSTARLGVYSQCVPFAACMGGTGDSSCATGYRGNRCARCMSLEDSLTEIGPDADPPGYYRRDGDCQPCPKVSLYMRNIKFLCFFI